jgi:hypothetical protein
MKVGQLKKLLAEITDDNMDVVVSGRDHSYYRVGNATDVIQAELSRDGYLYEYYDEENKNDPNNPLIDVLWIDDGRY